MKQFRRILCMLLAVTLMVGVLPASVLAEELPAVTETENPPAETPAEEATAPEDTETVTEEPAAPAEEEDGGVETPAEEEEEAPAEEEEEAPAEDEEAPTEEEKEAPTEEEEAPAEEEEEAPAEDEEEAPAEEEEAPVFDETPALDETPAELAPVAQDGEIAEPMAQGDKLYYDANAGSDAVTNMPSTRVAGADNIVKISDQVPQREGYRFLGWSGSADGAVEYKAYDELSLKGDKTVYAIWQKRATLTYDGNGEGVTVPAPEPLDAGESVVVAAAPERAGYRFDGWLGSDGQTYQPGAVLQVNDNLTLTAQWVKQVHLDFDGNGGTVVYHLNDIGDYDVGYSYSLMYQYVDATRDGYQFLGWSMETSGDPTYAVYKAGLTTLTPAFATIQLDDDVTLYAIWGKNYTLTYDGNAEGDTTLKNVPDAVSGTYVRGSTKKPSRTGYTFVGWSYTADGSETTTDFTKNSYYKLDKDTTLYAVWQELVYTIKFDLNGGSGTVPETITYTSATKDSAVITLPAADGYTKEGRTLIGWSYNTKRTDVVYSSKLNTSDYAPGATIPTSKLQTPTKDTTYTVYAVWQKDKVTLSLDMNGGTKGPAGYPKAFSYGDTASLPLQTTNHTKTIVLPDGTTGKIFGQGYYCPENGQFYKHGNMAAGAAGKMLMEADATIIWVWTYSVVTFMDGETTLGYSHVHFAYGTGPDEVAEMIDAPEKEHYTFKGWATSEGGEVAYAPDATYNGFRDITLYAVYELNQYTVTYVADDAEDDVPAPAKYDALSEITVAAAPTRTGYDFDGWQADDEAGTVYQPDETFTLTADITLTATWTAKKITVTFDANAEDGAVTEPTSVTRNYGVNYTISQSASRISDKYTFEGWATEADATEPAYKKGDKIALTEDVTLYAVWLGIPVTVTFDQDGGEGAPESIETRYNETITLPESSKQYYNFLGWSDGETTYEAGAEYLATGDVTLTAQWQIKQVTIHFDLNGGDSTTQADVTQDAGTTYRVNVVSTRATRAGYQFLGWDHDQDATDPEYWYYYAGMTTGTNRYYTETLGEEDVTLYAIWGYNWTLTFDGNADGDTTLKNVPKATQGTYVRGSTSKPSRTGYTFVGWSYTADGSETTTDFTKAAYYKIDKDTTLYAVWQELVYTVKFDLNGGSGTVPETITYTAATKDSTVITLPAADGYTKEGATLIGWSYNTKRADVAYNGKLNKADYAPGATLPTSKLATPTKDTTYTVYAVWKSDERKVTLDLNGGTKGPNGYPKSYSYGATALTPLTGPAAKAIDTSLVLYGEASNYFDDWYSPTLNRFFHNGNTTNKNNGTASWVITEDTLLVAVFRYTVVTFVADGEQLYQKAAHYDRNTFSYDVPVTMEEGPEKEHYTFKGWATSEGGEVKYAAGDTYADIYDLTLYAVYELNQYTVTYAAEDAESEVPAAETLDALSEITVEAAPTRAGYKFIGWQADDEDGTVYQPDDTFTLEADITLTALWLELTHVEAVEPICEEAGNIEYWYSEEPEAYYADENGTDEITAEDTVIPAAGHKLEKTEAVAPTCEEAGNIEYYTCAVCGKLFADEDAKTEITEEDTVLSALGHAWDDGQVTKAATCTAEGEITYTCKNDAAHTYTEAIGKLAHVAGEPVKENVVEATETTDGSYDEVVYCTVGGEELSRKTVTVPATGKAEETADYIHSTISSFGPRVKDIAPELTKKDVRVTPVDLSQDGTQTFDLIAGNHFVIGTVTVTVNGDSVKVEYEYNVKDIWNWKGYTFYTFFADLDSVESVEADDITARYEYGVEYSIANDLNGDTDVLLFVCNKATHTGDRKLLKIFYEKDYADQLNEMLERIGKAE